MRPITAVRARGRGLKRKEIPRKPLGRKRKPGGRKFPSGIVRHRRG